jgi:hypothetical protein
MPGLIRDASWTDINALRADRAAGSTCRAWIPPSRPSRSSAHDTGADAAPEPVGALATGAAVLWPPATGLPSIAARRGVEAGRARFYGWPCARGCW